MRADDRIDGVVNGRVQDGQVTGAQGRAVSFDRDAVDHEGIPVKDRVRAKRGGGNTGEGQAGNEHSFH